MSASSIPSLVEAFLDESPAFLENYVRRKIPKETLSAWLAEPAIRLAEAGPLEPDMSKRSMGAAVPAATGGDKACPF